MDFQGGCGEVQKVKRHQEKRKKSLDLLSPKEMCFKHLYFFLPLTVHVACPCLNKRQEVE